MPLHIKGLNLSFIKSHPSIAPLMALAALGPTMGLLLGGRTLLKSPDVQLVHHNTIHPYDKYRDRQYKLVNLSMDYKHLDHPEPELPPIPLEGSYPTDNVN